MGISAGRSALDRMRKHWMAIVRSHPWRAPLAVFALALVLSLLVGCLGDSPTPEPPSPAPVPAQPTPPPAAPTPVPPTAVPKPTNTAGPTASPTQNVAIYTVQPGDTLRSIADRFGITIEDIARLNDIPNPDQLNVGQQVRVIVPPGVATPVPPVTSVTPASTPAAAPTTAPAAPTAVPPASGQGTGGFIIYTVQPGDILKDIAARHGVSLQALIQANNLPDPNNLEVGQQIRIPR